MPVTLGHPARRLERADQHLRVTFDGGAIALARYVAAAYPPPLVADQL